jgi:hypothetical protein
MRQAMGSATAVAQTQELFDAAVIVQTVLRPSLERAIDSVFAQRFAGRIQVLIGVDKALGDRALLARLVARCPRNMHVTVFDPGYSTSARHGSLYSNHFGGGLRTILAYAANSRYVAYLDDDDWFGEDHVVSLRDAIEGCSWSFSLRWYVNPADLQPICVDTIESVGPGKGVFAERFGGFVCPSTLMLDKVKCHWVLPHWCNALGPAGDGEDRLVFDALRQGFPDWRGTERPTCFYVIKPEDGMHPVRMQFIATQGYNVARLPAASATTLRRV